MKKRFKTILMLICLTVMAYGQDMNYARFIVKELSSPEYLGRGYVGKGDSIAAHFIQTEMKKMRLRSFGNSYFQPYSIPINTFPEEPVVKAAGKLLKATEDYIVSPACPSVKGEFNLVWLTAKEMKEYGALSAFLKKDLSKSFLVVDSAGLGNKELFKFAQTLVRKNVFKAKGVVLVSKSLKFSARTWVDEFPTLIVKQGVLEPSVTTLTLDVKNHFIKEYNTQNVIGYIPGKSDSTVVFVAHYDHLGKLGNHIYHGALDNASGVSMVMTMAKEFARKWKKPNYTLIFALVSGEEAGLQGSHYLANNPVFPLAKVKQVLNFDMVGTGEDGVYFFNGQKHPDLMNVLIADNKANGYLPPMHNQGVAANSDHASFYEKGVPSVGLYTGGDISHYHQPHDTYETVSFHSFEGLFKILKNYVK